jgi:hypothetical protein
VRSRQSGLICTPIEGGSAGTGLVTQDVNQRWYAGPLSLRTSSGTISTCAAFSTLTQVSPELNTANDSSQRSFAVTRLTTIKLERAYH